MPLTYPIATTAKTALSAKAHARSKADAERAIDGGVRLVSDWLRPSQAEYEKMQAKVETGVRDGYVQIYEAKGGKPVMAVTYWKREKAAKSKPGAARRRKAATKPAEDHTDDLYFSKARKPRPAVRRARRPVDPRQMDLFIAPDRRGHEGPDPMNPKIIVVEEEGTGGTLGSGRSLRDSTKPKK